MFIMESEGGSRAALISPPKAGMKIGSGFTVIVDDIDETVAYFSANGFKPLTGVIAAAHTRITILLWEAVNMMICVMQHVED